MKDKGKIGRDKVDVGCLLKNNSRSAKFLKIAQNRSLSDYTAVERSKFYDRTRAEYRKTIYKERPPVKALVYKTLKSTQIPKIAPRPRIEEMEIEHVTMESLIADIPVGGRPVGSFKIKTFMTEDARLRLSMLGFDPMEELIRTYDEATALLDREMKKDKPVALLVATYFNTKSKAAADLLRYGYARIPEGQQPQEKDITPVRINLQGVGHKPMAGEGELIVDPTDAEIMDNTIEEGVYEE
jgi:hypothetical protein